MMPIIGNTIGSQLLVLSGLVGAFVLGLAGMYFYQKTRKKTDSSGSFNTNTHVSESIVEVESDIKPVVVLYGSLRGLDEILDSNNPKLAAENATELVNDFLNAAARRIEAYKGTFERYAGKDFVGIWGMASTDNSNSWRAMRCALDIRRDFSSLNQLRKVDGQKEFSYGLGLASGRNLIARLGKAEEMRLAATGETNNIAAKLSDLCAVEAVDILIAGPVWEEWQNHFICKASGQAHLSSNSGLVLYHSLLGYKDEQNQEIIVEMPVTNEKIKPASEHKEQSWLVNNGSRIVGPLTVRDIAFKLYSQEMDFDSECWHDETGNSSKLAEAKIFSGCDEAGATLWVFDGDTVHGPLTSGFLETALVTGAINNSAFVCDNSTVNGWLSVEQWRMNLKAAA